ncbi:MAG: molybdopterin molybdotransferase MoeA [Lachnospiraceae bacterium]|nr:molybdopterin molybdotransferase MoeA [Lachnospiraceae bacterium]
MMGISINEAVGRLLERVPFDISKEEERVPLWEAAGRIAAHDICAPGDIPGFNRSAMDGYAICHEDVGELKVVGRLFAGDYEQIPFERGTAVRVMTGAFIPDGYDCVVMQEDTDGGEDVVKINKTMSEFENYCHAGEDIEKGELVIKRGTLLKSSHTGILASLGYDSVEVKKPVPTRLISTGSEIMSPGEELLPGKIYNSSAYMLMSAVKRRGLRALPPLAVMDDEQALGDAIDEAAKSAGVIITTGGVSVGQKDIIPGVLERLGAQIIFRGVDIQPGTPTIGAVYKGSILLCLSGNPFAALANFEVYYWEVMAKLMGCEDLKSVIGSAVLKTPYEKVNRHTRLVRAFAKDGEVFIPGSTHHASVISDLTECNCLIELEAGRRVNIGERVKIRMLSE